MARTAEKMQLPDFRKLINTDSPRLANVNVGPTPNYPYYESHKPLILLIDSRLVGRHEHIKPWKLPTIKLGGGWHGAGIAAAAVDEKANPNPDNNVVYQQINEALAASSSGVGLLEMPKDFTKKERRQFRKLMRETLFAKDGHHRLAMSRLNDTLAVIQVFPFPNEEHISLDTWLKPKEKYLLTQHGVIDLIRRRKRAKAKQTKFRMRNGEEDIKLSEAQPTVDVPREDLKIRKGLLPRLGTIFHSKSS